ncbi:uncharacterized protein EI90DRAFT_2934667 [Cantharellus anzutake]|uniref:uncharacterized protein n=1 Tax=Cantharellus anzutake TaxID=1750568 RepID=UPI001906EDBE|nr:uncharacterized protein EI90DRAFT_2934667 [Cantharellus anzutake]KAF8324485.1 hypothetical protein EI90DRAFT_2934667 [Cantharellus anzutake]
MGSRRSRSGSPPPAKRFRLEQEVSEASDTPSKRVSYRNGAFLAPMVRSGTLPSRLLALKYGADLVWGPEVVDRAIIGCERVIDGDWVISYEKNGRLIWSTHPIEKPYLVYQIGSANPQFAVQAALTVIHDVSAVDLNCGCPKPFSTHAGMGANLLYTPDLLCEILSSLRSAIPSYIPVTAKIRLLPDANDTLKLVERIVKTGISALTVHCRTKDMRKTEEAHVHRLGAIVDFVNQLGEGIPVIENGDCTSREDGSRIKERTGRVEWAVVFIWSHISLGVDSVMIATAAERNLSCFANGPLLDAETVLSPTYLSLARYLKNPWGNSKHCVSQFTSPSPVNGRAGLKAFKDKLGKAKGYLDFDEEIGGTPDGKVIMDEIKDILRRRTATALEALEPCEPAFTEASARIASVFVTPPQSPVTAAVQSTA